MSNDMTKIEKQLFDYMIRHANVDVPIHDIYSAIAVSRLSDARRAQQYVGAVISRVNKKQNQYEIIPGLQLKRTYRLQTKTLLI